MTDKACRCCGAPLLADGACRACLLETGIGTEGQTTAEKIFQVALHHDASERDEFIELAAGGDRELLEDIRMLLAGYVEAGGDHVRPTMGPAPNARAQWAAKKGEEPGTIIDHFELIRAVGEGGMGTVWEAEQETPIRRRVALKVIKLGMDTREVVRRFERERLTLALMNHPCIAQVFEAGSTPLGRPYFAMELVDGNAITSYCIENRLDVRARLELFLDVCSAVEHAHQKGVIHRDLKPTNILVSEQGVKVIDFGVAKATTDDGGDGVYTRQAQILGTPAYMSPEQAESDGLDVDTRTDIYSLGVVLYELLSGGLPFDPKRLASTGIGEMRRILREEEPPRPSTKLTSLKTSPDMLEERMDLRGDLDWIVLKAMSKDRTRRYDSASAFSNDIRSFLDGEIVSAVPPTLNYRLGKFVRRHRSAVAAAGACFIALAVGLIFAIHHARRADLARLGEKAARAEATFTLADMYTRSGLTAARNKKPERAALWFAHAAIIAAEDPPRAATNGLRAATWRTEFPTAIRAFDTGYDHLHDIEWNPRQSALIVLAENVAEAQIWDLQSEQRWQPDKPISRASWSPDGKYLAAISGDAAALTVVKYPSGETVAELADVPFASPRWSPDGRWIFTGSSLWDWQSSAQVKLPAFAEWCDFTEESDLLVIKSQRKVGICRIESPAKFLFPPISTRTFSKPVFIGNGDHFIVGQESGTVETRESTTGSVVSTYPTGTLPPSTRSFLAASPDGRYIARESQPTIDTATSKAQNYPVHQGAFIAADFSPDGRMLASGGYDSRLELWSLDDHGFLGLVGCHHSGVVNVRFSPDSSMIASGEDGLVRVWRLPDPPPVRSIEIGGTSLVRFSENGEWMIPSGFTNESATLQSTRLFDIETGDAAGKEMALGGILMDAAFGPGDQWIALAISTTTSRRKGVEPSAGSGHIEIRDPHTGILLGDRIPLPSEPRGIALNPSGEWLGVACEQGEGIEIDLSTKKPQLLFKGGNVVHAGGTLMNGRCGYSDDGRIFAVWGLFENIRLWDREHHSDLIPAYEIDSNSFDLAMHGEVAARAIVAIPMRLEFHNLHTGKPAAKTIPYTQWPFLTRFNRTGEYLLTAGAGNVAQVWDWRAGSLICPPLAHDAAIMAGTFIEGTPWVVTGSHDQTIRFWDQRTGLPIRPPIRRPSWVLELQTSPDGKTLVASGLNHGAIELIDLASVLIETNLDPVSRLRLAEIDASAEVHPGGGISPFTPSAWLEKWQTFRRMHPDFPGHQWDP